MSAKRNTDKYIVPNHGTNEDDEIEPPLKKNHLQIKPEIVIDISSSSSSSEEEEEEEETIAVKEKKEAMYNISKSVAAVAAKVAAEANSISAVKEAVTSVAIEAVVIEEEVVVAETIKARMLEADVATTTEAIAAEAEAEMAAATDTGEVFQPNSDDASFKSTCTHGPNPTLFKDGEFNTRLNKPINKQLSLKIDDCLSNIKHLKEMNLLNLYSLKKMYHFLHTVKQFMENQ